MKCDYELFPNNAIQSTVYSISLYILLKTETSQCHIFPMSCSPTLQSTIPQDNCVYRLINFGENCFSVDEQPKQREKKKLIYTDQWIFRVNKIINLLNLDIESAILKGAGKSFIGEDHEWEVKIKIFNFKRTEKWIKWIMHLCFTFVVTGTLALLLPILHTAKTAALLYTDDYC